MNNKNSSKKILIEKFVITNIDFLIIGLLLIIYILMLLVLRTNFCVGYHFEDNALVCENATASYFYVNYFNKPFEFAFVTLCFNLFVTIFAIFENEHKIVLRILNLILCAINIVLSIISFLY